MNIYYYYFILFGIYYSTNIYLHQAEKNRKDKK